MLEKIAHPRITEHLARELGLRAALRTPPVVRNWRVWALRRALMPLLHLPCWVESLAGARHYLGRDPIADLVLLDLLYYWPRLYIPEVFPLDGGDTVLDIGAHHGSLAIEVLGRCTAVNVVCVEPNAQWWHFRLTA